MSANATGHCAADDLDDEIRALVGKVALVMDPAVTAEPALIRTFAAAVEDGNPLFWDDEAASQIAGEAIAPPAMISTWMRPDRWRPGGEAPERAMELHYWLKDRLGLERAVVGDSEMAMFDPVRPGDRVYSELILDHIGPQITNRLGTGRKWTITLRYRREGDDVLLGTESVHFFNYNRPQE